MCPNVPVGQQLELSTNGQLGMSRFKGSLNTSCPGLVPQGGAQWQVVGALQAIRPKSCLPASWSVKFAGLQLGNAGVSRPLSSSKNVQVRQSVGRWRHTWLGTRYALYRRKGAI